MSLGRFVTRSAAILAAGAAFSAATLASGDAHASGPVSPTGKGIVGGALLGGEVVTLTLGAVGVERGWPYFVFGAVGAAGGGVGGYFVEKATKGTTDATSGAVTGRTAEPALYMLAGGMALLIPALVVSLNATSYKPPDTDRPELPGNEPRGDGVKIIPPGAQPPPPPGALPSTKREGQKAPKRVELASLRHVPVSLFDVYKGKVGMGLPAVEVRPLYSQKEMFQYGVSQGTEVHFPVFKAMF
jgi:hypothetical protein